jgi:trigger factor
MIDEEIDRLLVRNGKMTEPDTISGEENVLNLTFVETDENGQVIEGGIHKDNSLLVKYFKENIRGNWIGKKKDDEMVLQLIQAFDEKELEWILSDLGLEKNEANRNKYFRLSLTKLGFIEKPALDEPFFAAALPGRDLKTIEDFRTAIKDDIQKQWDNQTRSQLQHNLYHELINLTSIAFPEAFLKRWLLNGGDKPKTQEEVEHEFPAFADQLKWTLILDKVVRENNIEVKKEDLEGLARQQLMGYLGMGAANDEQPWIKDYINRMMQDKRFVEDAVQRIRTDKVLGWAESQVNPVKKEISSEEFGRMQEEHQHHHH